MAHFAEIDKDNVVLRVIVIDNNDVINNGGDYSKQAEEKVASYMKYSEKGVRWVQTSYNTKGNIYYDVSSGRTIKHVDQTKAKRKNYAIPGSYYNEELDAFIPPKPYPSWILNNDTGLWECPVLYPNIITYGDNVPYFIKWDEINQRWLGIDEDNNIFSWIPNLSSWVATGEVNS